MFVQSNEIKAKIPIIKREVINEYGTDYEWGDEKINLCQIQLQGL